MTDQRIDVVLTFYNQQHLWPLVLHGLIANRDNIATVIIAKDGRWGDCAPACPYCGNHRFNTSVSPGEWHCGNYHGDDGPPQQWAAPAWVPTAPGSGLTIQLLDQEKSGWGAGKAINLAVQHVTTPIFAHLDADMMLAPSSLATSLLYMDDCSLLAGRVIDTTTDAHLVDAKVECRALRPDARDINFRTPLCLNLRHGHFLAHTDKWLPHPTDEMKVDGLDAYFSMDYVLAARWMLTHGRDSFAYGGGTAFHLGGIYDTPPPEAECDLNKRRVRRYLVAFTTHFGETAADWNAHVERAVGIVGGDYFSMPHDYVESQRSYNATHSDGSIEGPNDGDWVDTALPLILTHTPAPTSILDIGCRTGCAMDRMRKRLPDARIHGIDIVPEFVERAAAKCLVVRTADVHALPHADGEFEWVTCVGTFEHFYNVALAAREMARVAARGIYVTCDLRAQPLPSDYAHTTDVSAWRTLLTTHTGMRIAHEATHDNAVNFLLVKP